LILFEWVLIQWSEILTAKQVRPYQNPEHTERFPLGKWCSMNEVGA